MAKTYNSAMIRAGIGYDVHRLVPGRRLVLGGVEIPYSKGLDGHSDADVLIHAICDALLGAAGLNDIGHMFPNSDPTWKDAPSTVFLGHIREALKSRDTSVVHVDATVIAQEPKIAPFIPEMRARIARALGISTEAVNIKATTNEGLGFIGRGEGIAAFAVATLQPPKTQTSTP